MAPAVAATPSSRPKQLAGAAELYGLGEPIGRRLGVLITDTHRAGRDVDRQRDRFEGGRSARLDSRSTGGAPQHQEVT